MAITMRDAEATRNRLLDAGREEFARYGIAGARVDRIAAAAQSNKAQIYHYYGSKDGLLEAVMGQIVGLVAQLAPIDATNLPEYAGRLFDGYTMAPTIARLLSWRQLERDTVVIDAIVALDADRVDAIAAAQKKGLVSTAHSPEVILWLVLHLAATWVHLTPEYRTLTDHLDSRQRRQIVVDSVRAVTAPTARTGEAPLIGDAIPADRA